MIKEFTLIALNLFLEMCILYEYIRHYPGIQGVDLKAWAEGGRTFYADPLLIAFFYAPIFMLLPFPCPYFYVCIWALNKWGAERRIW